MFKILRIVCSVIAALFVAVCVYVFIFVNFAAGILCAVGALLFFVLTLLFKYFQEEKEELARKNSPAAPSGTQHDAQHDASAASDREDTDGTAKH